MLFAGVRRGYARRMAHATPFTGLRLSVPNAWIDYNGHLNVGYYAVAFDKATDALLDHLDLGAAYRFRTGHSIFVIESHTVYLREVAEGDALRFDTRLLDADHKRLHLFHAMFHEDRKYLAATSELMAVHVDLEGRRSVAFPDSHQPAIDALSTGNERDMWPEQCGRVIGIRRTAPRRADRSE